MIVDGGVIAPPDQSMRWGLRPNTVVTCEKPWEGISGPLQVMSEHYVVTWVWVIDDKRYADVPTCFLKEQPFLRAIYYRRHGWLKKLRPYWFRFKKSIFTLEIG